MSLWKVKKISSHTHKTRSWYVLGFFFSNFLTIAPIPFMEVIPTLPTWELKSPWMHNENRLLIIFSLLRDLWQLQSCLFILFQMNYTRQRWSNNFHCVKIHTDLVSVVALTVFFCFLPIIFYVSLKMQGDSDNRKTGM